MLFRKILETENSLKKEKEKLSEDLRYWISFLKVSSKHYKHTFEDQIMINLYHPEFTACADAGTWRSINREISSGHGVPTIHNGKIRYLIDISQTSGKTAPWVWTIDDQRLQLDYSRAVSSRLADKYGLGSETFEEQLYDLALIRTSNYLNSEEPQLFNIVAESAAYAVICRCCPDEAQPSLDNFKGLNKYPIDEIGQAVTEISRGILLEIEDIVKLERQKAIEEIRRNSYAENTREDDQRDEKRMVSEAPEVSAGDNGGERMDIHSQRGEFRILSDMQGERDVYPSGENGISGDGNGIGERSADGERNSGLYGSGIQPVSGGNGSELLQDVSGVLQADTVGNASGDTTREIRDNAQELSSQSEAGGIHKAEKKQYAQQASDSDKSDGARTGRNNNREAQKEQSGVSAGGESGGLYENSTAKQQLSEDGRGRNSDRTDIQIIGNTVFRYIPQKTYRKYDTETALKIADRLYEQGIKFSGKVDGKNTTITVSKSDIERLRDIALDASADTLKSEFIEYASDKLINDTTVRNTHKNSDLENFNIEIDKSISELFTKLIIGEEQIENHTIDEIDSLYNKFQSDKTFSKDICSMISENVDISLTQLEITRDKANELGIPFSDKLSDGFDENDELNMYIHDGSMSLEDFRKMQMLNDLSEITSGYDTPYKILDAFEKAAEPGWEKGDNIPKLNRIKKALYDILEVKEQTEKAFACIAKYKYNVSFEAEKPEVAPDSLTFQFGYSEDGNDHWFTESGLLSDFVEEHGEISFALANALMEYLDDKQRQERMIPDLNVGYYKKTKIEIKAVIDGQDYTFANRFDIGDGKGSGGGSIIDHIRTICENTVASTDYPYNTPESKETPQNMLNVLVSFLETHSELTAEEQRVLDDFKGQHPIRTIDDVEKAQGKFQIYQISSGNKYHGIRYEELDRLKADGVQLNKEDYELVYEGIVGEFKGNATLEALFAQFNTNHPEDFRGHSLSLSDVVVVNIDGEQTAYYCDTAGFVEMPEFFREKELVQEKPEGAKVSNLAVGDIIMYEGSRREVEDISERSITLKDLNAPDFGGVILGTSDVLAYNGWQEDMESKGFEILHKHSEEFEITQADIDILRTLEPRKSILNFSDEEMHLTEKWQKRFSTDIHEKSPYYRAVNGDWRENDDTKINVIQVKDRNVDFKNVRNDIKSQVIFRGNAENSDTGWTIQISRNGLEDSVKYAFKHQDNNIYNMLYNIQEIIEKSILLDSVVSEKNNSNKAYNTAFMHKMYCVCQFNNEPYLAKSTVEEFADSQNGALKRLYNVQDIKIEPLRRIEFTDNQLARSVLNGTEISIADLFKIVKFSDKDFYVNKHAEIKKENMMDKAVRLINEYCEREFGSGGNFSNTDHIDLAYGTDSETGVSIEVYADLETFRIVKEYGGKIVNEELFDSLDNMSIALEKLEFDKLVSLSDEEKADDVFLPTAESAVESTKPVTEPFENSPVEQLSLFGSSEVYEPDLEEKAVTSFLTSGSGFQGGKSRIEKFCKENHTIDELAKMLKNEYGIGGSSGNEYYSFANYNTKGVEIILNRKYDNEEGRKIHLSWKETAKRISRLVAEGRYIFEEYGVSSKITDGSEAAENVSDIYSDYRIKESDLSAGGAKAQFRRNIEAIRILKNPQKQNPDNLTDSDREVLSKYAGWGGLSAAFDKNNEKWSKEYEELKNILSEEEYLNARASVLDSFYTPPFIIESIYKALENMGFQGGSVLDPSTGTGNFLGKMPDEMYNRSRIFAVEKDSLSGRIAKLLYPNANVRISGFERTDFSDNFFDVAVSNIPFGNFKISDRKYDKYNFAVHDYFFAKALDKVRPGGVIAFITSTGTLDKQNPSVRKYISQRAELLGAVRLPNNAFKSYAGTEVTSDIIFLQKREKMIDITPEWVYTGVNPDGFTMNNYFLEHPEMILGTTVEGNKLYGKGTMTAPFENADLQDLLAAAVMNIHGNYAAEKAVIAKPKENKKNKFIPKILPADPNVKNFSYTEVDGRIFYRENSIMTEMPFEGKKLERISGMVKLRNCVHELLNIQLEGYSDEAIISKRNELNKLYDDFTKKNGLLNDKVNRDAFNEDVSRPLILSLEKIKDGKLERKADIFTKRTLQPPIKITHADTAADALAVSISEKAGVDLEFMSELMDGKPGDEIISALKGAIYLNPETRKWETANQYLSGNIRSKLAAAKNAAEANPEFAENAAALEAAMPERIEAGDITAKLGSPWIDDKYIEQFMYELFDTPKFSRNLGISKEYIGISHNPLTAKWNVKNKSLDSENVKANTSYGTSRKSGYSILEDSLNMIDTTVYDPVYNPEKDKKEYVVNHDETLMARQKQEAIETAFREWIFKDPKRREYLVEKYNVLYNSIRPREYDGSHLTFAGMNPEITLKKHQKDAVAHALYGENTLFAHKVGAGKTYEMIAAAQEGKRLGLHNKSLIAVPNHMTEQFANDYLELYPNANILVAVANDFEKNNRQKLCAKIATGDFDAIIIGHSQLIKIPVSKEREEKFINNQIEELVLDIAEMKEQNAESFTIKDMERTRREYEAKLKKLVEKPVKDDVVTFEEMGVDKLFIDEADMFKNLSISTKMRNISGVAANRNVQKTQDLYIKCQYLDELTGGKGIVFATGTPVSNSISELFIMQKYLQADYLRESGLTHFDAWAANYAQKVTKLEYAPTGKGFRQKTRLSKFNNLPELMTAFKECADIKTAEDLKLPEPECKRHIIAAEPTAVQKEMIEALAERAEKIHNKQVTPDVDNMLKVTTDGIKIGLDQRLMNPILPDEPETKINLCVNNVFDIWKETAKERLTQVIFCDFSTPKKDGSFNLYDDVKLKLIEKGIPENEIAFIHNYEKPIDKERLFEKVRNGEIRVLLGSTQKMGAGTNIQNRLYAMHHLDTPWKPRDMEQRLGRMKRQGNINEMVHEYIYVTKDTFDSYRFQTLETKQGFISQIMTSKNPVRVCEDVSQSELEFAEVKALCAGNPLIKEKMEIDIEVAKLQTLKAAYLNQHYKLEDNVLRYIPESLAKAKEKLSAALEDSKIAVHHALKYDAQGNIIFSGITINGQVYADKKEAGNALIEGAVKALTGDKNARVDIGEYRGFRLEVFFDALSNEIKTDIKNNGSYRITLSSSDTGNITRLDNAINHIADRADEFKAEIKNLETQLENSKIELEKPFPHEQELRTKLARQSELDRTLNLDNKENLLGKDNVKSFELETKADRKKAESCKRLQNEFDMEL